MAVNSPSCHVGARVIIRRPSQARVRYRWRAARPLRNSGVRQSQRSGYEFSNRETDIADGAPCSGRGHSTRRAGRQYTKYIGGDASVIHSHVFYRESRTHGALLRGWPLRRRAGQGGHGRRHVRGSVGAETDPAAVPDRVLPRQRAERHHLAGDARWPSGLGVLPD